MRKRLVGYRKRIDALLADTDAYGAGAAGTGVCDADAGASTCDAEAGVAGAIEAVHGAEAVGASEFDWDDLIQEHLVQISFFQHERLIHLLVTLAFALMEIACVVALIISPQIIVAALALLLLVLLVPYIVHYYFLENETQKLYAQYDLMLKMRRAGK